MIHNPFAAISRDGRDREVTVATPHSTAAPSKSSDAVLRAAEVYQRTDALPTSNLSSTSVTSAQHQSASVAPHQPSHSRHQHHLSQPQPKSAQPQQAIRLTRRQRRKRHACRITAHAPTARIIQREIEQMVLGGPVAIDDLPVRGPARRVHFQKLEHAIVKSSGEDITYSADDFFRQIEQVLDQVDADEVLRSLALRNSLTGAARLLLTHGAVSYDDLKGVLIREFGWTVSHYEVYRTLDNRRRKPTESIRRFVMEMEIVS